MRRCRALPAATSGDEENSPLRTFAAGEAQSDRDVRSLFRERCDNSHISKSVPNSVARPDEPPVMARLMICWVPLSVRAITTLVETDGGGEHRLRRDQPSFCTDSRLSDTRLSVSECDVVQELADPPGAISVARRRRRKALGGGAPSSFVAGCGSAHDGGIVSSGAIVCFFLI